MTQRMAVITGAGQGMGRAIALRLAQENIHCVLVGRTERKLQSVAAEIVAMGQNATVHAADVSDSQQVAGLKAVLAGMNRSVDMLINCAGEALIRPADETTEAEWERVIAINLKGPFLMTQALLPLLRQSENASILSILSKVALGGFGGVSAYSASKTGLLGFMRSLAAELAKEEIRVVALCPGPTDTPMRHAATPDFDPKTVIQPDTIADLVAYVVNLPRGTTAGELLVQSAHFL